MRNYLIMALFVVMAAEAFAACEEYDQCSNPEEKRIWIQSNLGVVLPEGGNVAYGGDTIVCSGGQVRLDTEAFTGTIQIAGNSVIQDAGYASYNIASGSKVTVVDGRITSIQGAAGQPAKVEMEGQSFTSHQIDIIDKQYGLMAFSSGFPVSMTLRDGTQVTFMPPPKGEVIVQTNGDIVKYESSIKGTDGPYLAVYGILGATEKDQMLVWGGGTILGKDEMILSKGSAADLSRPDMYIGPMRNDVCIATVRDGCANTIASGLDYIRTYRTTVQKNGRPWEGYAMNLRASGFNEMDIQHQDALLKDGKVANPLVKINWEKMPAGANVKLSEQMFYQDDTGNHFGSVPIGLIDYQGFQPSTHHKSEAMFGGKYLSLVDGAVHEMYANSDEAGSYEEGSVSVCSDCKDCGSISSSRRGTAELMQSKVVGWWETFWSGKSSGQPVHIDGNTWSLTVPYEVNGEILKVERTGDEIDPKTQGLDRNARYFLVNSGMDIVKVSPDGKVEIVSGDVDFLKGAATGTQEAILGNGEKVEFSMRPIRTAGFLERAEEIDSSGKFMQEYSKVCRASGYRPSWVSSPGAGMFVLKVVDDKGVVSLHEMAYDDTQKTVVPIFGDLPGMDKMPAEYRKR